MNSIKYILVVVTIMVTQVTVSQNYFEQASTAIDSANYVMALELAQKQLSLSPKNGDAYFLVGVVYYETERYDEAIVSMLQSAKYLNNKSVFSKWKAYVYNANSYKMLDQFDKAEYYYNKAIKCNKENSIQPYLERAIFYYNQQYYQKASADYNMVLYYQPTNAEALTYLANTSIHLGDTTKLPLSLYNLAIKNNPTYSYAYWFRFGYFMRNVEYTRAIDDAITYMELTGRFDDNLITTPAQYNFSYALAAVSRQIKQSRTYQINWRAVRIDLYENKEMYEEALVDLESFQINDSINKVYVLYRRAQTLQHLGRYKEVIEVTSDLINLSPDSEFYTLRANAYEAIGEKDDAIEDYKKIIELEPQYGGFSYFHCGYIEEKRDNLDKAIAYYSKSLSFDMDLSISLVRRGMCYFDKKDSIRAQKDFEMVLKIDTVVSDLSSRHYALAMLGRSQDAQIWMNKLIDLDHTNAGTIYDAACLYARMGMLEESILYLNKAIDLGYNELLHITEDSDLDSIRYLPEYKVVIDQQKQAKLKKIFEKL